MSTHKGDIGLVEDVLGWDCRGTDEEYEALEKASKAFTRIKKEIHAIRKELKDLKSKQP